MKAFDFDAVIYDGQIFCNECCPVSIISDEVEPIFADQEWDDIPVCVKCGCPHEYVSIT